MIPDKPKIFIASPLFNPPQIAIISGIEALLEQNGFDYYSARKHSGSDRMTPEDRKDIRKWDPVFDSNEAGLDSCDVCIAVLEYALPSEEHRLGLLTRIGKDESWVSPDETVYMRQGAFPNNWPYRLAQLELPDAGTVWECGYMRAQGKIVFGFHTDAAKHLNLMLSHGCDGLIKGWANLTKLLTLKELAEESPRDPRLLRRYARMRKIEIEKDADGGGLRAGQRALKMHFESRCFDWSAVEGWDAATKEIE